MKFKQEGEEGGAENEWLPPTKFLIIHKYYLYYFYEKEEHDGFQFQRIRDRNLELSDWSGGYIIKPC